MNKITETRSLQHLIGVACNPVVHLPSEMALHLTLLFAQIVADAGFPAGSYHGVAGPGHEIGARNKTPNTLGLSGRSPTVVMPEADLDKTVPLAARSIFMFAGQGCIGTSQIYVERPIHDEFVNRFTMIASKVGMGDLGDPNTEIAPTISDRQRTRVRVHIAYAVAEGATVVTGGAWQGNRCKPTLLTSVTEEMTVCRTETFGPVTAIYPIGSYEEGLEKANDTDYGLSSAIFTKDIDRAFHCARCLRR